MELSNNPTDKEGDVTTEKNTPKDLLDFLVEATEIGGLSWKKTKARVAVTLLKEGMPMGTIVLSVVISIEERVYSLDLIDADGLYCSMMGGDVPNLYKLVASQVGLEVPTSGEESTFEYSSEVQFVGPPPTQSSI